MRGFYVDRKLSHIDVIHRLFKEVQKSVTLYDPCIEEYCLMMYFERVL